MASATAIPNCSQSSHHAGKSEEGKAGIAGQGDGGTSSSIRQSYSPTNTSPPRGVTSPIYTQAGRSAFSMPGPNSASTSPTTTSWYSAGFASGNSQRVRSPTLSVGGFGNLQQPGVNGVSSGHHRGASANGNLQRDYFGADASGPGTNNRSGSHHFRTGSFSSGTSSISSADLEPVTPRGGGGSLGANSLDQIKGGKANNASRRESWTFSPPSSTAAGSLGASGGRWTAGLGSLRDRPYPPTSMPADFNVAQGTNIDAGNVAKNAANTGGMTGLFRKLSLGSGVRPTAASWQAGAPTSPDAINRGRSDSVPAVDKDVSGGAVSAQSMGKPSVTATTQDLGSNAASARVGRRTTVASGTGAAQGNPPPRRRPSPMGERLLMGHFTGH